MKKTKKLKKAHGRHYAKDTSHSFWYWGALGVLLFVVVAVGAYFASSSIFDRTRPRRTNPNQTETLLVATDKATIMLMGVDERTDDIGRSDTLMLATVDPKKNKVSLFSIPRDTRVDVPGYGYDKINVAYSLGGHRLTQETVEEFLDTPIDHYVLVKIGAFKRIVDAIGGVDIDVEMRMQYVDEWDDDGGLYIDLYPGMQHMDGKTAITYVRYRDEEGDIGRVRRQQKFMKAVMDQVTSPAIITRLPDIIREVMGAVETDMSFRQILELAGALKEAKENGLKTATVSGRPAYIDEIFYWIPDLYQARESIASMLDISMTQRAKNELEREASAYEASLPPGALETPDGEDIIIRRRGDGARFDEARSSVEEDETGKRDTQPERPSRITGPGRVTGPERRTRPGEVETETTPRPGVRPTPGTFSRDPEENREPRTGEDGYDNPGTAGSTGSAGQDTETEPSASPDGGTAPQETGVARQPAGAPGRGAGDMVKR